ncbi:glycosyltransferase family 4 protein [Breznakibacter xylanolyticus]|nr:glycosyltransferase family 4 protein [Breznakibacter xylanolyticus]
MGGMQKHSYYLAKYFARKGIEVDVYHAIPNGTLTENQTAVFSDDELKYLHFIPIHFPRNHHFPGHYIWESYLYSKQVYQQFVKQQAVDFVYAQGFSGWRLLVNKRKGAMRQRKKNDIPVGINFHGLEMFQKAPNLRVKLEHLLLRPWVKKNLRMADVIFSLGGRLTPIQQSIAPSSIIIDIPNGISDSWITTTVSKKNNTVVQFVFIGRYERRKGIEELTSVLTELSTTHPNSFTCHFIGPIPEEKRLHNDSNVVYHGSIREESGIKSILRETDVLLCPSWSEGMPTVILEAMACGCAIIASDVGAVRDQVGGDNGILIVPGNKQQLKDAMVRMIQMDKTELQSMQQASIDKVKSKFLWDDIIDDTIKIIDNMVNNNTQ